MTPVVVAVVAIVIVAAVVVVLLRRRSASDPSPITRDAPTVGLAGPSPSRLGTRIGGVFRRTVDESFYTELEEALLAADVGVSATSRIVDRVRESGPTTAVDARTVVRDALLDRFSGVDRALTLTGTPAIVVVVGVNGSGKTTTIAKLASDLTGHGSKVLVAAADTFRAAAAEQLVSWSERVGFDVVRGGDGADPASVAFDARAAAVARGHDVVIVDTAGRLHSKQNLMDELSKVVRVLSRDGEVGEILLVLDGSIGQNGIAQAAAFIQAVGVTGAVITKLDGSGKGGVAIAVEQDLGVPIKFLGFGEGAGDLLHFEPEAFVDELLGAS